LRGLGGGDEGHAQQPDHQAVPPSLGVGLAAGQMLEVRVPSIAGTAMPRPKLQCRTAGQMLQWHCRGHEFDPH